jgi:hypothetical protein
MTPRSEEELKQMVKEGIDALDRGDYIELDEKGLREFLEQIKREGRERLKLKQNRMAKEPRLK